MATENKKVRDFSMYTYYKGSDDFPTAKARFFGHYEMVFDETYEGRPEDKEESFKSFISDLLYEQASDIYMFGMVGVDKGKCYSEYIQIYLNPELEKENYER